MENINIIDLVQQCPDVIVSIRLGDLIEANTTLVQETKRELEAVITDQKTETYPSVDKVAEILSVDKTTLWRWNRRGYLTHIEIGGKRRYKMSDIQRILNGSK